MSIHIYPSMMCADYDALSAEVRRLDDAGSDVFHIDIMDGSFVPNFAMDTQDIDCIRKNTKKKLDVHLMIDSPGNYVELFAGLGADIIYVHPEADRHIARTLAKIKLLGKQAGVAVNPGTSAETILELLPLLDYLLVMTVNPGFAGQNYCDFVDEKIKKLAMLKKNFSYTLAVDGAISEQRLHKLSGMGVEGFVLGTSALFGKKDGYAEIIRRIRQEDV